MTEQENEIRRLLDSIKQMTEASEHIADDEVISDFIVGRWMISSDSVIGFMDDQGIMIHDLVNSLPNDVRLAVIAEVGELIVGLIDGISRICTLRDLENEPIEEHFPSVLPLFLAKLRGRDFLPLLQKYRDRFANSLNEITSEQIQLFKAFQTDPAMQAEFEGLNDQSFEKTGMSLKVVFQLYVLFLGPCLQSFPILHRLSRISLFLVGKKMNTVILCQIYR